MFFLGSLLNNGGKDCWDGCNKKQGKCGWCGKDGWCCRKGWMGNGCDGTFGGPGNHRCALKTGMYIDFKPLLNSKQGQIVKGVYQEKWHSEKCVENIQQRRFLGDLR